MNGYPQHAGAQPRPSSLWDSLLPWRTADATAASFRFVAVVALYGAIFYLCLGPILLLMISVPLIGLVRSLGGAAADEDLAVLPVLVVIAALYAPGPLGCLAGIVSGIRGLIEGGRGRAIAAVILNGALLAGIVLLFLMAYAMSG